MGGLLGASLSQLGRLLIALRLLGIVPGVAPLTGLPRILVRAMVLQDDRVALLLLIVVVLSVEQLLVQIVHVELARRLRRLRNLLRLLVLLLLLARVRLNWLIQIV